MKKINYLVVVALVLMVSCDEKTSAPAETCGDGVIDIGEDCDGISFGTNTCSDLGYYAGSATCNDDCTVNLFQCESFGKCGDNTIDAVYTEECDGTALDDKTCQTEGFHGGELSCNSECKIDRSDCVSVGKCGDGIVQTDFNEECDGQDHNEKSCISMLYYGGTLTCKDDCTFDIESCISAGKCGDGETQTSEEECDGDDLDYKSCQDIEIDGTDLTQISYYGGTLSCKDDCTFNVTTCEASGWCGDNLLQDIYEQCDGTGVKACSEVATPDGMTTGYDDSGTPACGEFCEWNIGSCQYCGDGEVQVDFAETCDQNNFNNTTCTSLGYYEPENIPLILYCGSDCKIEDTNCVDEGKCGDGIVQANYGEECDTISGISCGNFGFVNPEANCTNECKLDLQPCYNLQLDNITSGENHSCGFKSGTNTVWCWGKNEFGQLGNNTTIDSATPVRVLFPHPIIPGENLDPIISISAGNGHTCVISTESKVYCWGNNEDGQLGDGTTDSRLTATRIGEVILDSTISSISAGGDHTCVVVNGGNFYCWGKNNHGQLGIGNIENKNIPTLGLSGTYEFTYISSGDTHTCGVVMESFIFPNIVCWGNWEDGRLGVGYSSDQHTPVKVKQGEEYIAYSISAGFAHTCALVNPGTESNILCWGKNSSGQLGDGTTTQSDLPVEVTFPSLGSTYLGTQISAGFNHTCVTADINSPSQLSYCWGEGTTGALGNGILTNSSTPVSIIQNYDDIGGGGYMKISAGNGITCGTADEGSGTATSALCWGNNSVGQLGNGTTTSSATPIEVIDPF
jgi:alpha-tubulin suppressor-like RCC1 family protein